MKPSNQLKSKNKILYNIWEYIMITVGLLFYCLAWKCFLLPHQITGGGVTGISAIVYYVTEIPVGYTYFAINAVLLILSIFIIGWRFSIRSVYGVLVLTSFLSFIPEAELGTFVSANDGFMACVVGGIIWGVGYAFIFMGHGSSGGTTIIATIINHYIKLPLGRALLCCDVLIICSSYFFVSNGTLERVVYGLVTMAITTYVVDLILNGVQQSIQFMIISDKYDEIASRLNEELSRGITQIDALGWHKQQKIKILIVIVHHSEVSQVSHIINSIDKEALVSQMNVASVSQGFKRP